MIKKIFPAILLMFFFIPGIARAEGEILTTDQLEPGMRGYGKTVFSGQRIDTFAVEVLGVMEKVMPDQDLILIKAEGDTLAYTNIISGMSGSPIYIDDKLIGSLAYSWAFEKDPIAGVTPIENILNASASSPGTGIGANFQKITTPLVASGFTENSLSFLTDEFKKIGLPVQFISGGNRGKQKLDSNAVDNLQPGAAVGIQLVRGDLNLAAIGTATEIDRENKKIYALGHPFLNAGEIELPLTTARVQTYIPSLQSSFKIASPDKTIGTITEDRQATVSGKLGVEADLLPIQISLESPDKNFKENYSVEIVRNEFLTPGLINSVAANFVQSKLQQLGVNKITTNISLQLARQPDLNISRVSSAASALDYQPFYKLQNLWRNPFQEPEIESAKINLTLQKGDKSARISNLWADRSHVTPGEELTIFVEINPHRKEKQVKKYNFTLPETLPGERVRVSALPATRLAARSPEAQNLEQIIRNINTRKNHSKLAIIIEYPGINVNFKGIQYENLPAGFARMFAYENNQEAVSIASLIEQTEITEWSLNGEISKNLPVKTR